MEGGRGKTEGWDRGGVGGGERVGERTLKGFNWGSAVKLGLNGLCKDLHEVHAL